jgi:hypothetical protein
VAFPVLREKETRMEFKDQQHETTSSPKSARSVHTTKQK